MNAEKLTFSRYCLYCILAHYYSDSPSEKTCQLAKDLLENETFCQSLQEYSNSEILLQSLNAVNDSIAQSNLKHMQTDYHYLFIGVTEGQVNPYASWHLAGAMLSKPLADLRADLKKLGLARDASFPYPEDSMACLLETMALLVDEYSDEEQAKFYLKHIDSWSDKFLVELAIANKSQKNCESEHQVYKSIQQLTECFFVAEQSYLFQFSKRKDVSYGSA